MDRHFCAHNATKILIPCMLMFVITLIGQIIFIIKALWEVQNLKREYKQSDILSTKGGLAGRYSYIMVQFWKNSKPISCGTLDKLVKHIFSDAFNKITAAKDAIVKDPEIIQVYAQLVEGGSTSIFRILNNIMGNKEFSVKNSEYVMIVDCIKNMGTAYWSDQYRKILKCASEKKYWEVFMNLLDLEIIGLKDLQHKKFIQSLNINLDEIGEPYDLGRSMLYYANLGWSPRRITSIIKSNLNFDSVRTHNDGKSISHPVIKPEQKFRYPSQSQKRIGEMFGEYKKDTEKLELKSQEYKDYMLKFAGKLSRYKFHQWDVNLKELAEFANSKKQWVVLVELLNAFIVLEPQDNKIMKNPPDFDCGVANFEICSEEEEDILLHRTNADSSLLYYALRKPDYLPCFLFTAIRHILNHTRGQQKFVRGPDGNRQSAIDFVRESETLDTNDKEILKWMLKESMKIPSNVEADTQSSQQDYEELNENDALLDRSESLSHLPRSHSGKTKRRSCVL